MTRTKLNFIAALLAASLIASLSVYGLAEGQEPDDNRQNPQTDVATLDEIDVDEIRREVEHALEAVPWAELADVRGILEDIDLEGIRADVKAAMAEIDVEQIHAEVREALEDVDWDEIRRALEDAKGFAAEELQALDAVLEDLGDAGSGVI